MARGLGNGYTFGNDFYPVWLTSRAWIRSHISPYSPEMTSAIQVGLLGRPLDPRRTSDYADLRMFVHPAFTDLLLWPLSEFPFPVSRIVMFFSLAVMTSVSVALWLQALDWHPPWRTVATILLLTISSYPALEGLFAIQLGLLVTFLLAASLAALKSRRFLLAGFLIAFTTIKPQMSALTIVYLFLWACHDWNERKQFVAGLLSTLALLVGASVIASPTWIQSWIRTVLIYRRYTTPPLVTAVLTSSLGPRMAAPATFLLTAGAIIAALVLAWRNRNAALESEAFWLTLAILLSITTIFVLPGQAVYDHLILVPALLLLVRDRDRLRSSGPVPRLLLIVGAVVLVWPWIAAFALIVLRPLIPRIVFDSTAVLALPLRTAASLPFAVLALLVWMWRINRLDRQEAS